MKKLILAAASGIAMTVATPALAADVPQDAAVETVAVEMSDARYALALGAVDAYWPQGNSQYMVDYLTGTFADELLYTPIGELVEKYGLMDAVADIADMVGAIEEIEAAMEGEEGDAEGEEEAANPMQPGPEQMAKGMLAMFEDQRLIDMLGAQDEHLEERITIAREVLNEELPPMFAAAEPEMRKAFAEAFARRFDDQELAAIAAFAATPTGQKYAKEQWVMSFDPAYFKAMIASAPAYIEGMPALVEKMDARMAHLPPMFPEDEDEGEGEEAAEGKEPTAEELIAEAEELEAHAAEILEEAAALRAKAAEL